MLDKRTTFVMSVISDFCSDGSYKIIEVKDFLDKIKPKFISNETELHQIIKYLKDLEFIDIKYSDEKVYCIALLPKGRLHDEQGVFAEVSGKGKQFIKYALMFLAGFLGAIIGTIIGGLF